MMSAHVFFNLLNELRKRDKMRSLPSILSLFGNEFNKFNKTRARMLDSIYHYPHAFSVCPSVTLSPPKPLDEIQPNLVCELLT